MKSFLRAMSGVLLVAALLPVNLSSQELTFEQKQAVESLGKFLDRLGLTKDGDWIRQGFASRRLYFREGAETGEDKQDRIFINPTYAEQISSKDEIKRFRALADLAATLMHERTHLGQTHWDQGKSELQHQLGGGHPTEVEGWRSGFQAYREFVKQQSERLRRTSGEHEQEQEALRLRELVRGFERYQTDYEQPGNHFGAMTFADGSPLAKVAGEMRQLKADLDRRLAHADFKTTIEPHKVVAKPGEPVSLRAKTVGGAFNDPKHPGDVSTYEYQWTVGGSRVAGSGPTLQLTAAASSVVTAVAVDRLGAKSSEGRCELLVAQAPPPAGKPAPPARAATRSAPSRTAPAGRPERVVDPQRQRTGHWEMRTDPPEWSRQNSTAVFDIKQSANGYSGTYVRKGRVIPVSGTFTPPPGSIRPGDRLSVSLTSNHHLVVQATRSRPYEGIGGGGVASTPAEGVTDTGRMDIVMPGEYASPVNVLVKAEVGDVVWYGTWNFQYRWVWDD